MTEKRYTYSELNNCQYSVDYTTFKEIYGEENVFHSRICEVNNKKQAQKVVNLLNEQEKRINKLKETIIKITLSYHQKHDNTIVNLVDEVYEEDIGDLFIEWNQGDVE